METVLGAYGRFINEVEGKVVYIALVKRIGEKVFLMNTAHRDCPKYELDWFCLNYMNNLADVIVQTSQNTRIDENLHVFPCRSILEKYGVDVVEKVRVGVITTTRGENINFESSIFNDELLFLIYSKRYFECKFPVVEFEQLRYRDIQKKAGTVLGKEEGKVNVLIEAGTKLFNLMMKQGQYVDYLFFTVLDGDENGEYLAGELDMEEIGFNFEAVFESGVIVNDYGKWTTKVYKHLNHQN